VNSRAGSRRISTSAVTPGISDEAVLTCTWAGAGGLRALPGRRGGQGVAACLAGEAPAGEHHRGISTARTRVPREKNFWARQEANGDWGQAPEDGKRAASDPINWGLQERRVR
jgi:hypothetical protein